jgi:AraC-like DNA-binding protein
MMDYRFDFFTLSGLGIFFIALFLGLFFLLQKKFKNDGYVFLYASIIFLGYELFYKTLIHSLIIYDLVLLYIPGRFFNLLIYPIFLFFIWSITRENYKPNLPQKLLLFLFILYSLYKISTGLSIPTNEKIAMLNSFYKDTRPGPFNYWLNLSTLIKSTLIPLLFLSIMAYDFFRFKKENKNDQTKRLMLILSAVIVIYFLYSQFSNLIYKWAFGIIQYSMIEWPADIIFLSIIVLLLSVIALLVNTGSTFFPPSKYSGSALASSQYEAIIKEAKRFIEEYEWYKNEEVSLSELSKSIHTNPRYLSQAINHHLKISFVDFLNAYRIEEAKKQLLKNENATLTLEAIGLMAGFKSKSAFFRAFKKATDLTPNQFIQSKRSAKS